MIKDFLLEEYGENEPIFLNDLSIEGMSENEVRQSVKRLNNSGFLKRYDKGIYYIPKQSSVLNQSYLNPNVVIMRKYIENQGEVFGFITGISLANQLGITSQVPAVLDIVTNKEATNGRNVQVGTQKVRIRKPIISISKNNVAFLQFIDLLNNVEKYTELDDCQTRSILIAYLRHLKLSKNQLYELAFTLTGAVSKKLIEWRMIDEFT